jgi:hypothetical protein
MVKLVAVPLALIALHGFHASVQPLPASGRAQLNGTYWHRGCPVSLSQLRLLTVSYWDFDGNAQTGEVVVNAKAAAPLSIVFRKLYAMRFPIHHMRFADVYGPARGQPADGDVTGSFECRQAVPSPCSGGTGTGTWSNHAYGLAVDVNPVENPYVGCGMTRDRSARKYLDRSHHRKGMVTPAVVSAFRSVGWGWGGAWSGSTKDYMHFSWNGH